MQVKLLEEYDSVTFANFGRSGQQTVRFNSSLCALAAYLEVPAERSMSQECKVRRELLGHQIYHFAIAKQAYEQ